MTRHLLTDAELDEHAWASCGPTSLAALLGRSLAEIRRAFPAQRPGRTWTNLAQMQAALRALGVWYQFTLPDRSKPLPHEDARVMSWPQRGLVLLQFRGSWDAMPLGHPAQLERTHWIAVAPAGHPVGDRFLAMPGAFDVNLVGARGVEGGWTSRALWEEHMPALLAEGYGRRATGEWWIREGLQLEAPAAAATS